MREMKHKTVVNRPMNTDDEVNDFVRRALERTFADQHFIDWDRAPFRIKVDGDETRRIAGTAKIMPRTPSTRRPHEPRFVKFYIEGGKMSFSIPYTGSARVNQREILITV